MNSTFYLTITTGTYNPVYNDILGKYIPEYTRLSEETKEFKYNTDILFEVKEKVLIPELNKDFHIFDRKRKINGDVIYFSYTHTDNISRWECEEECDKLNTNNKHKKSLFKKLFG